MTSRNLGFIIFRCFIYRSHFRAIEIDPHRYGERRYVRRTPHDKGRNASSMHP
jgi:hypothetical protein